DRVGGAPYVRRREGKVGAGHDEDAVAGVVIDDDRSHPGRSLSVHEDVGRIDALGAIVVEDLLPEDVGADLGDHRHASAEAGGLVLLPLGGKPQSGLSVIRSAGTWRSACCTRVTMASGASICSLRTSKQPKPSRR